jgi:hypothetical protein
MATDIALVEAGTRAAAVVDKGMSLSTAQVIERTKRVREVMEAVMKPNVHYGVIPGTPKPTMFQPGADVLNVTFRIAPKVAQIDDLSTDDCFRYRIIVRGVHQVTDEILSEGVGECSSDEEKYRWRKAVCDEEWNETPEDRRRAKWAKGQGGKPYKAKQVRTSPADVANTVLKMAVKRAKVAMTISATAASDVFAQDLEDLSDELREHLSDEATVNAPPQPAQRVSQQQPSATPEPSTKEGAPAAEKTTAQASPVAAKNIGIIVEVKEREGGAAIVLNTGFKCSTKDGEAMQAAAALRDSKRRVELVTTPAADPKKYMPRLSEIQVLPEQAQ